MLLAPSDQVKYKGFDEDYPQPVSVALDFLPIIYPQGKPVYIPDKYEEIILRTYDELEIDVEPDEPSDYRLAEKSDIDLKINYTNSTSLIIVNKYGADFRAVLSDMISSLEENSPHAIYLDLPLENKATPEQSSLIESSGFIYSGLMPQFHHQSDFLRLQKIYLDLDFSIIEIYSDFGNKIKSIVAEITGDIKRLPLVKNEANQRLWEVTRSLGRELDLELEEGKSGGVSDGNFTNMYSPTIDGLGAVGEGAHAYHEKIFIDETLKRAGLLTLLLLHPSLGG